MYIFRLVGAKLRKVFANIVIYMVFAILPFLRLVIGLLIILVYLIMCISKRFITNKYTGKQIWVDCGRCSACLQKKRNYQKQLITYESSGYALMVTLTYSPENLPYVFMDLNHMFDVYRGDKLLKSFDIELDSYELHRITNSKYTLIDGNKIGVLYKKDIQNFFKRLRKFFKGFDVELSSFTYCGEYGSISQRPHFHILFFTSLEMVEFYKTAIFKTWKMCDWDKLPIEECFKYVPVETTKNYVASYLNKCGDLPALLQEKVFQPYVHHSNHFGFGFSQFAFDVFFNDAKQGIVTYSCKLSRVSPEVSILLYPKYVVSRYFPKIKGYSRLTYDDFVHIYKFGLSKTSYQCGFNYGEYLELDDDDVRNVNRIRFYCLDLCKQFNIDYDYYLYVFYKFYILYACYLIRSTHFDSDGSSLPITHLLECYTNFSLYFRNNLGKLHFFNFNPNYTKENLKSHQQLLKTFNQSLYKYELKKYLDYAKH